ncbi:MAG TPA: SusD/RagB family nutrient-binding outer membrane lipoprotein [Bacteroidales bacterium]|nr:SusD/RagB family nutrient-binding outer membrane lipoprotein [Bacteroidales bacterium]
MKNKYFILLILVAFIASCTDKFEEFNTDSKNPATVTGEALFSNAQLDMVDQISSTNVNLNVWKLFAQYWTETTYTDEANYDIINRSIPDLTFRQYYRGFLKDFNEASLIISETIPTSDIGEVEKTNKLAIIELLNVYSYQNLVDIFGNIPYTEAMDITKIHPVYDDAATIYQDLINRLDAAMAKLDASEGSYGSADIIYQGDVAAWKKFGNSLKLKIGIALADANPTLAKSTVEAAIAGGVIASNDENALLYYLGSIHTNPIYVDVVQSGRDDFVPANTVVDLMNDLTDPRRELFFTAIDTSTEADVVKMAYVGGIYGESNPFSQYSHIADPIIAPDFPGILLTYDEVLFYRAEAAERGFVAGGTASDLYEDAVTASILYWGGTAAEATAYLAQPNIAYATAAGTWKQKIGTQAYIAFYTRGFEGYTQWRRLDFPMFNLPPSISEYSEIPVRFTYPVNEQTLNDANYKSASAAIGGDDVLTKLFWDKF